MVSVFSLMSVMRLKKSSMGHNGTKWPDQIQLKNVNLGILIWASGHLDLGISIVRPFSPTVDGLGFFVDGDVYFVGIGRFVNILR